MIFVKSSSTALRLEVRCYHCNAAIEPLRDGLLLAEWDRDGEPVPDAAVMLHFGCVQPFLKALREQEWHFSGQSAPRQHDWRAMSLEGALRSADGTLRRPPKFSSVEMPPPDPRWGGHTPKEEPGYDSRPIQP